MHLVSSVLGRLYSLDMGVLLAVACGGTDGILKRVLMKQALGMLGTLQHGIWSLGNGVVLITWVPKP